MKSSEEPDRDKAGRFKPGVSGNPGGRSGNTKVLRESLAKGAEKVASVVMKAAIKGDIQACRLILERLVPALKPVSEPVSFALDSTDLPATARSIMAAISGGILAPEQGKALIDSVASMARVVEISELEKQLIELRALMEAQK